MKEKLLFISWCSFTHIRNLLLHKQNHMNLKKVLKCSR